MSKMQHFSWLMLLQRTIHNIRSWIFLLALGIFKNISNPKLLALSISIFILLAGIEAFYHWLSYRFFLDQNHLLLHYGFIFKHQIDIPYERIQAVHKEIWFLSKPFNIAKLTIETASSNVGKPAVVLESVPEAIYEELEKRRTKRSNELVTKKTSQKPVYRISVNDLLVFTFTDIHFISVLLAASSVYSEIGNITAKKWLETQISTALASGVLMIIVLIITLLVILFVIVLVSNFLRYFHFFVRRTDEFLIVERGLFTRRRVSIPVYRIQALQLRQSLLRNLLGLQTVEVVLAAGKSSTQKEDVNDDTFYLLPIIRNKDVWQVLQELLPEWTVETAITGSKEPHWFLFTRFRLLTLIILTPVTIYFSNFILGAILACLVLFLTATSFWASHIQAVATTESMLHTVAVTGISRIETLCPVNKIQSLKIKTSYYLEKKRWGHFEYFVKAGLTSRHVTLRYLDLADCSKLKTYVLQKRVPRTS